MKDMKSMKPRLNSKYSEGVYPVQNKHKYLGDISKCFYRSSYELTLFKELDLDPAVKYWVAEPPQLMVRYYNPLKRRWARYFPDAFCLKEIDGKEFKCIIEVKPKSKLIKPTPPKIDSNAKTPYVKRMENYQKKLGEYLVIDAKRRACSDFAKLKGMIYIFITEDTVKAKNRLVNLQ